jgi:hypothetical protein
VMPKWPSSLTRTACPAGASCAIPATTPPLSRDGRTFSVRFFFGFFRQPGIPAGRPGRGGRAAAGTPREQCLPSVCSGGRNDEHLVPDLSGRAATELGRAAGGGRAGRRAGGGRRPAWPLVAAPGHGESRREAGGSAPGQGNRPMRDPAPSVSGGSAATWRGRRSTFFFTVLNL